jgi:hypothetical protein
MRDDGGSSGWYDGGGGGEDIKTIKKLTRDRTRKRKKEKEEEEKEGRGGEKEQNRKDKLFPCWYHEVYLLFHLREEVLANEDHLTMGIDGGVGLEEVIAQRRKEKKEKRKNKKNRRNVGMWAV